MGWSMGGLCSGKDSPANPRYEYGNGCAVNAVLRVGFLAVFVDGSYLFLHAEKGESYGHAVRAALPTAMANYNLTPYSDVTINDKTYVLGFNTTRHERLEHCTADIALTQVLELDNINCHDAAAKVAP